MWFRPDDTTKKPQVRSGSQTEFSLCRSNRHTYIHANKQTKHTDTERESTVNDLVDKRRSQEGNGSRETGVSGERAYLGDAKQTTEGRRGAKESEDLVKKKSLYLYRGRQMLVAVGFKPRSSKSTAGATPCIIAVRSSRHLRLCTA